MAASQLRSHVLEVHKMADYRYQCDRCHKRFDKRAVIRNHYRDNNSIYDDKKVKNKNSFSIKILQFLSFFIDEKK